MILLLVLRSLSRLSNVLALFWDKTLLGLWNPFGSGLFSLLLSVPLPPEDTVLNVFDLLTPDDVKLVGEIGLMTSDPCWRGLAGGDKWE